MLITKKLNLSGSVQADLGNVDLTLKKELSKGNPFISKEALRLLNSGGKRLRPLFTILFSRMGEKYDPDLTIRLAAAIETMHMATLVHDDTIDNSETRRGIDTTFKKHGIHTAVYTGDWMLIRSLRFLSAIDMPQYSKNEILDDLATGLEMVCEGEMDQYYGRGAIPRKNVYYDRIKSKTASLFASACVAGAKAADLLDPSVKASYDFGIAFGIAFQIRDDLLDITNREDIAKKTVENDLKEGIVTLPVLLACEASADFRERVTDYLNTPNACCVKEIVDESIDLGGIEGSRKECDKYLRKCKKLLSKFPDCDSVNEIENIIDIVFDDILSFKED